MSDKKERDVLDIRPEYCPITFVRAKLKLEDMEIGSELEILLSDGEPVQNVPRSLKHDGHEILSLKPSDDGSYYRLIVKKGEIR